MLIRVSFRVELNSEHRTKHLTSYWHIRDENSEFSTFKPEACFATLPRAFIQPFSNIN